MVGLPWGQLKGLLQFLSWLIMLSMSSIVILVLPLTLALHAMVAAKWSRNLLKSKFFSSFTIVSRILLMIFWALSFGNQVGCDVILNELVPNSSAWIFSSSKIFIFFLIIKNSFRGNSITIGISVSIVLLLGWDNR